VGVWEVAPVGKRTVTVDEAMLPLSSVMLTWPGVTARVVRTTSV
jgi:hypothetical protein